MNAAEEVLVKALPPGAFHRRIAVIVEKDHVRGGLEDEMHRFEIMIAHNGTHVTDIVAKEERIPSHACRGLGIKIRELIGVPLQRMQKSTGHDARQHCTHLFDLARVVIARAAVGKSVQYDVAVPDMVDMRTRASIMRNGVPVLTWDLENYVVTSPEIYVGHNVNRAPQWHESLDEDMIEAGLVLRRVCALSHMRLPASHPYRVKVGDGRHGDEPARRMAGACFGLQPEKIEGNVSNFSWHDYANTRDELLSGFDGVRRLADMR